MTPVVRLIRGYRDWYDGVDQNCDGASDFDKDGDGEDIDTITGGTDCDDEDATINTAATEVWYDGVDQDCSGGSDYDQDGDGEDIDTLSTGTDCDDTDASINTAATEIWYDGVDQDCTVARTTTKTGTAKIRRPSRAEPIAMIWTPRLYSSNRDLVRRYRPEL